MTITQWEYALALDKHRHFGRAAKACHVAQPTLSMQLQKLEDELGVIIFDRSKNPILPTLEGEKLLAQARVLIREFKKIPDIIDEMKGHLTGQLRLAIIPTLGPYLTPLFLKEFLNKYPAIELSIEEQTTEQIIKSLNDDTIDVACMATPLNDDQLIERVLFYDPFSLYCSEDHPLLAKQEVDQSDLEINDLWLLTEGHCFRNQVLKICQMDLSKRQRRDGLSFESGSLETLKNMVDKSFGHTLLPQLALSYLSESQSQRVRKFSGDIPTREISLVHSRSFLKERLIVALEKTIIENIPESFKSFKGRVVDIT